MIRAIDASTPSAARFQDPALDTRAPYALTGGAQTGPGSSGLTFSLWKNDGDGVDLPRDLTNLQTDPTILFKEEPPGKPEGETKPANGEGENQPSKGKSKTAPKTNGTPPPTQPTPGQTGSPFPNGVVPTPNLPPPPPPPLIGVNGNIPMPPDPPSNWPPRPPIDAYPWIEPRKGGGVIQVQIPVGAGAFPSWPVQTPKPVGP